MELTRSVGKTCAGELQLVLVLAQNFLFFSVLMQTQSNHYFRHPSEISNWRRFHSSELLECLTPLFHPIRSKIKPIVTRSQSVVFPRFASAACNYLEFLLVCWTICVLFDNQSINQSINQPINQSINQSIDRSIDQSIKRQSINQSCRSINQNIFFYFTLNFLIAKTC